MKKVLGNVCLAALAFSTMEVALKIGGSSLDSLQLTFLRFLLGGLVLIPLAVREWKTLNIKITLKDFAWIALIGIVGVPVSMLSFQFGIMKSNAATASSIICLNALFTMLISHIFTDEKMTPPNWISFGIGIIAAGFMLRFWDIQVGNTAIGLILLLTAAVTFAAYTVMSKVTMERIGVFVQTSMSFLIGSLILLCVILLRDGYVVKGVFDNLNIVLYAGVVVTGLGYVFYFLAIKASDAITGSITFFIKPVIAPILAMFLLNEKILWNTVAAVLLLLLASFINFKTSLNKKKSR